MDVSVLSQVWCVWRSHVLSDYLESNGHTVVTNLLHDMVCARQTQRGNVEYGSFGGPLGTH